MLQNHKLLIFYIYKSRIQRLNELNDLLKERHDPFPVCLCSFKRCEEPSADTPVNGSGRYSEEIKLLDKKGASPR